MNNTTEIKDYFKTEIQGLEQKITKQINQYDEMITAQQEVNTFLRSGIEGLRTNIIKDLKSKHIPRQDSQNHVQNDPAIGYPHRKILNYLKDLYQPNHQEYEEAYFSEIVKNCRLGKNKAGEYLRLLEEKGLIHKRTDGYRIWWKIQN